MSNSLQLQYEDNIVEKSYDPLVRQALALVESERSFDIVDGVIGSLLCHIGTPYEL